MLRWSINLFRVFGIQLALHWTFLLLLVWAGWDGWQNGQRWAGAGANLLAIGLFFVCVILHELGHSLTARRYGVRVPRILLLPIGGMAEFDRVPRQPVQELLITIAGPAVNFVIAAGLFIAFGVPADWSAQTDYPATLTGFARLLLTLNLGMGCFNLLPVFPMDGGRIFRALLALKLPYLKATWWAATVGRILALSFALLAACNLDYPPARTLLPLFLFIFWAADAEYRQTARQEEAARYCTELSRQWRELASGTAEPPSPPLVLHGPN